MSVVEVTSPSGRSRRAPLGRCLLVLWQNPQTRLISPVGFLTFDRVQYTFGYIREASTIEDFQPLLGFDDLHREYRAEELFPIFAQRAMDPRRRDYVRFVERLAIDADATPWEQIARSGGRRPGDTLQLLPVPTSADGIVQLSFMVNGMRHVTHPPLSLSGRESSITEGQLDVEMARLVRGARLRLIDQPENNFNTEAIVVATEEGVPLGWVPDVLVHDLRELRRTVELAVTCEVANPPDAPWHLRLLVNAAAHVTSPFNFFTDERFERLADQ